MMSTISMSNSADNCDITAADMSFTDCVAEGVYFKTARLTRVTFTHCDIYWASFLMAQLDQVTFDHCDLHGSDFTESILTNCRFLHCDVGADAVGGETRFDDVDLSTVKFVNCRGR